MKKRVLPVLIAFGIVLLIALIIVFSVLIRKYSPSKERMSLTDYYALSGEEEAAIILDNKILDTRARVIDDHVYLDYGFVYTQLNSRFYWDSNENILLYTTASNVISTEADSSSYQVAKSSSDWGRTIVKATADSAWIDIDFVKAYTNFTYSYEKDPSRVIMTSVFGEVTTVTVRKDTCLRVKGGIKSEILKDLAKSDSLTVLEELDSWTKVATVDGVIGYAQNKYLSDPEKSILESDFQEESFTHIQKDATICMAWHQVTNTAANNDIASILTNTKGINVISPTWFYLNDNEGGLANLASSDYVSYCHKHKVEVWALVSNLENSDADSGTVLTHTSLRQNLVNQIVSMAIQYDLDGINLDFEALRSEVGPSYVQFVRELSIKLRNNGIILSIDNYVPSDYTAFYNRAEQAQFADYVVIMGYDQHTTVSEEVGSVAALDWVTESVDNTLQEVPATQTILGMPFYTRIWTLIPDKESEGATSYTFTTKAYGMSRAWSMVKDHNVEPTWDEACGQYFAQFEEEGLTNQVWLENSDSMEQRLKLMQDRNLAGAAFWKLGFETQDIWDTVIKYTN